MGAENWAMCVCLMGPDAADCVPRVWSIAKECLRRPADLAGVCDALCLQSGNLLPIVPEVVRTFKSLVDGLPREFSSCTNEASRFSVGVEIPCALVRLLEKCGPYAADAIPALKKYRWFIMGKSSIQSNMVVIDLQAGETRVPQNPRAQASAAIKAIYGARWHAERIGYCMLVVVMLVAVWWMPLGGHIALWGKMLLSPICFLLALPLARCLGALVGRLMQTKRMAGRR